MGQRPMIMGQGDQDHGHDHGSRRQDHGHKETMIMGQGDQDHGHDHGSRRQDHGHKETKIMGQGDQDHGHDHGSSMQDLGQDSVEFGRNNPQHLDLGHDLGHVLGQDFFAGEDDSTASSIAAVQTKTDPALEAIKELVERLDRLEGLGIVLVHLTLSKNVVFENKFLVVEGMTAEAILGLDFLETFKCMIDSGDRKISFPNEKLVLPLLDVNQKVTLNPSINCPVVSPQPPPGTYRKVNSVTRKDAYPLPRVDDILDTLGGSKWFSTLDLKGGHFMLDTDASDTGIRAILSQVQDDRVLPISLLKLALSLRAIGWKENVKEWCRKCRTCSTRKMAPPSKRAPLQTLQAGYPLQIVAVDILGPLPVTAQGNKYVLVACDCFTRWVEVYAIQNQEALTVAKMLVDEMFCRFSPPEQLHSDQGRQFEADLLKEVCTLLQIHKTRTTAYHPHCNGLCIVLKVRLPNTPYCRPLLTLPYLIIDEVEVLIPILRDERSPDLNTLIELHAALFQLLALWEAKLATLDGSRAHHHVNRQGLGRVQGDVESTSTLS
eukprot:Em1183g1a